MDLEVGLVQLLSNLMLAAHCVASERRQRSHMTSFPSVMALCGASYSMLYLVEIHLITPHHTNSFVHCALHTEPHPVPHRAALCNPPLNLGTTMTSEVFWLLLVSGDC